MLHERHGSPNRVMLHPVMFRVDEPDLSSGHRFSDLNTAFKESNGGPLMKALPALGLKFTDAEKLWSLVDDKGGVYCADPYDKSRCTSWRGFGSCEVVTICGVRSVGFQPQSINLEVLIFDHSSGDRVQMIYNILNGAVQTTVGVMPASECAEPMGKLGIRGNYAFLPSNFTPDVFRSSYLSEHFRAPRMFDFRSIRVETGESTEAS